MKTIYQIHDISEKYLQKWQKTLDLVAELFEVPAALIMRVAPTQIEVLVSSHSAGNPYEPGEKAELGTGLYCETVMASRSQLLIPNALQDEAWKDNPDIELDMISYLGIPLIWPDGTVFGTLCVLDKKTRTFSETYQLLLYEIKEIIEMAFAQFERAESEISQQRAELEAIVNAIPDAVLFADPQRRIVRANPAFTNMFGYQLEEVSGLVTKMIYADPENFIAQGNLRFNPDAYIEQPVFNNKYLRKDGTTFQGETLSSHVIDDNGELLGFLGIIRDTTERKLAEDKLAYQQDLLEKSQELGHIGTWEYNPTLNIFTGTVELERMFGVPPDLKVEFQALLSMVHPDDTKYVEQAWAETLRGNPYDIEYRIIVDDKIKWVRGKVSVTFDTHGKIISAVGITQDITERKEAEIAKGLLEKQLRQTHKMEAIGTMAGGIAHDFNNLLSIIIGNIDIIHHRDIIGDRLDDNIVHVKNAANRAKDLVSQILSFSRQEKHELIPVDLSATVDDALCLLRSTLPATVEIMRTGGESLTINADITQLQQVLINICANAVHAMNEKGLLKINLEGVKLAAADMPAGTDHQPGQYAKLSVSDTGSGMDEETLARVFDPFFTTKEVGVGTGMGLSVVHGIIEQHGGFINVDSNPGQGTTFNVYFPFIDKAESELKIETRKSLPTGTERILFIDDEECLTYTGKELLECQGYTVTSVMCSQEALKIFKASPDAFDLIFTDQTMPSLTGAELAVEVLKIRSDIPIILCSGYSAVVTEDDAKEIGISRFCMKPMDMEKLATIAREVLDEMDIPGA